MYIYLFFIFLIKQPSLKCRRQVAPHWVSSSNNNNLTLAQSGFAPAVSLPAAALFTPEEVRPVKAVVAAAAVPAATAAG